MIKADSRPAFGPGRIGIITFHCSDNFGAMLQAYGLLTRLRQDGFDAFIVNYCPFFLRGRDWFVPYVPQGSLLQATNTSLWFLRRNLKAGRSFFARTQAMKDFRTAYLTDEQHPIRTLRTLAQVNADTLIVGSDQIWNPDVTFGLRPAYFGALPGRTRRKTIAYAASLGAASLKKQHEARFADLLTSVDAVSLREQRAAAYVESRFGRATVHAVDPVFLLDTTDWLAIAQKPVAQKYVFYYETQRCVPLRKAACQAAKKKGLPVIGLSLEGNDWEDLPIQTAPLAGPSQFVGFIADSDSVFTNSFHGLAFSILLRKQFTVWNHTTVGSRLESLLAAAGLEERMLDVETDSITDCPIDWWKVQQQLEPHRDKSLEFLHSSLDS